MTEQMHQFFMKKNIACLFFLAVACSAMSQTLPAPNRLRCNLLLQTGTVSNSGITVKASLGEAVEQKDKFQFVHIDSKIPSFSWEVDPAIKKVAAYRILVAAATDFAGCFLIKDHGKMRKIKYLKNI